ncbi:hypothetical protein V1522DRAFT_400087 [Lipomyces starkeyi]
MTFRLALKSVLGQQKLRPVRLWQLSVRDPSDWQFSLRRIFTRLPFDRDDSRPAIAEELGAIMTINPTKLTMNSVLDEIIKAINSDTEGSDTVSTNQTPKPGVDVAMEYVVAPQTFDTCQKMIAPCGRIASIGVHGKSADLQLQDLWSKNITITTANTTCMLLKLLQSGKMKSDQLITHRLQLSQIERVYDTFGNHSKEHTIKTYIETDNL